MLICYCSQEVGSVASDKPRSARSRISRASTRKRLENMRPYTPQHSNIASESHTWADKWVISLGGRCAPSHIPPDRGTWGLKLRKSSIQNSRQLRPPWGVREADLHHACRPYIIFSIFNFNHKPIGLYSRGSLEVSLGGRSASSAPLMRWAFN